MKPSVRLAIPLLVLATAATVVLAQTTPRPARERTPKPEAARSHDLKDDGEDDDDDASGDGLMGTGDSERPMLGGLIRRLHARRAELARDLKLTDAQRDRIAEIRSREMHFGIQQRAKLATARLDLMEALRDDRADKRQVDQQVDRIVQLRSELERSRIETLLDMRGVLTPEQRRQLREELGGSL